MGKILRRLPILWVLVPLVALIVFSYYTGGPIHLLSDTEVDFMDTTRVFRVVTEDYALPRKQSYRYQVEILPSRARAYLYIHQDSSRSFPEIGDTLLVRTKWERGGMLGDFDYGKYLREQGLIGSGYVREQWKIERPHKATWKDAFCPQRWRHGLVEKYVALGLHGQALATVEALTLGYKEDLDQDLKQSFQKAGAAHILAVSGLHTGILYAVILWLLTGFGLYPPLYEERGKQYLLSASVVVLIWCYAALTGFTPSVVRCAVMLSLVELAKCWHRQAVTLNIVLAAAFFILCFRPRDLYSVSFQLSFAAVIGIVTMVPSIKKTIDIFQGNFTRNKTTLYGIELITVSLAAQLATMPISLYYFGQTSNYFLLTNMVVVPLAWLLVVSCIGLLALGWIPIVGTGLAYCVQYMATGMNKYVGWIEHLPHSTTTAQIGGTGVVVMYAIILLGIWGMCWATRER